MNLSNLYQTSLHFVLEEETGGQLEIDKELKIQTGVNVGNAAPWRQVKISVCLKYLLKNFQENLGGGGSYTS